MATRRLGRLSAISQELLTELVEQSDHPVPTGTLKKVGALDGREALPKAFQQAR
jgi:hypothetical protein